MVEGLVGRRQLTPRQLLLEQLRDASPRCSHPHLNDEVGVELQGVGARVTTHTIHRASGRVIEARADADSHITPVKAHLTVMAEAMAEVMAR